MAEQKTQEPLLVNIEKGAVLLGMSESWLRQQNRIPFVRVGRRKMFKMADIRAFIEAATRGAQARG